MDEPPEEAAERGEPPGLGGPAQPAEADANGEEPLEAFYGRDDVFGQHPAPAAPTPRVPPRKARTATGALLTGIALGLRDVFDPERKKDTIAIEQEAPAEPEGPQEYEVHLNGSPRDAQAIYRPWVGEEDDRPG